MSDLYQYIAERIEAAQYILIGGGSGLYATSTVDYFNHRKFEVSFPHLAEQGVENRWAAIWYKFPTPEEHWAFWAQHILEVRFDAPAGQAYLDLFELVKNKDYFVITTNVEDQFVKSRFDPDKVFTPQGNYGYFQCALPCKQKIWSNEKAIRKMIANMDVEKHAIITRDIPRCPNCGGHVNINVRSVKTFVEKPWMGKSEAYARFISNASTAEGNFLILEFGVGFNTPSIIRHSFEWYTKTYDNAFLIRFNCDSPGLPQSIADKSLPLAIDIKLALASTLSAKNKAS